MFHVQRKGGSRAIIPIRFISLWSPFNDDADLAQYEEESRMTLCIVERETRLLRNIDMALERIRTGDYGYCLVSGESIGIARLLIRPTAEYCTEIKNQMEQREIHYDKRR